MDWYCYFMERFSWGSNPYTSVEHSRRIIDELMKNPAIPSRISTEAAIGFLTAARDFAGDGCFMSEAYTSVMASLEGELHTMRELVVAADEAWAQSLADNGQGGGPAYKSGDYEVRPVDLDGEEPEELPEGEPVAIPALDDPDADDVFEAIRAMYGDEGKAGITGTRRPFPDWEHIAHWAQSDWLKLQTYKEKVLIAAGYDFLSMDRATNALAAAKSVMGRLPLPRQVELGMWAAEIVDGLIAGLERNLSEMCAGSLHSHQGGLVQKQLFSATNGQAANGLD